MTDNFIIPVSVLIILIACILYFNNRKINKNIVFLSAFLIIYAIQSISISLMNFGGSVWLFAIILNNLAPLYYLIPVFFYFSVRFALRDSIRMRKKDIIHFVPFLINLIAVLPYLFTSYDYKYEVASRLMCNYYEYMKFDFGLFYPPFINQIARSVLFLFYLTLSLIAVRKYIPFYKSSSGSLRQHYAFMIRSITAGVLVFSFFSVMQLIIYLEYILEIELTVISSHAKSLLHFSSFLFLSIPVYILINPRFLYGLPQPKLKEKILVVNDRLTNDDCDTGKVKTGKMETIADSEVFEKISEKIMEYMTVEKPYLDPKFTVHDICFHLNVPRHHIQYCLNMILKKSFTELKNEMRVAHAMELIRNNAKSNFSIDGIGSQSGFASNSNFYVSFKEVTGMTPSKWMEASSNSPKGGEQDHSGTAQSTEEEEHLVNAT